MPLLDALEYRSTGDWVVLALFLVSLVIQTCFVLFIHLKLPRFTPPKSRKNNKGVSVIICARNEKVNLSRNLPKVLEQDYPNYEVVVVNDGSDDGTEELLAELAGRYGNLKFTSIPVNEKFRHGKKLALTIGLKSAVHDLVLLTDADCYPASDRWLQNMASNFSGTKKIVLGYGRYERRKSLLNLLIRYETAHTAMLYLSFAIMGKPYMGVGRNLAYEKKLFFKNRGFARHYHIASGDDDLFVNETATNVNTAVEFRGESHTVSIPETSISNWIRQKQRHLTAGGRYNASSKFWLGSDWTSRILLHTTLILISMVPLLRVFAWGLFALFLGVRFTVFKMAMRRLEERYLLLPSLLLDPVLPFIFGVVWLSTKLKKDPYAWS